MKYALIILAALACSVGFYFVFRTVPKVGTWLGWIAAFIPILISIPFLISNE